MSINEKEDFIQRKLVDVPLVCEDNFTQQFLGALWTNAVKSPNRPAMIDAYNRSNKLTYAELYNASMSVAAFFEKRGFRKGQAYCLVLPSSWEYVAAFAGGTLIGGIASGCSMAFEHLELTRQFNDSGAKAIFCTDQNLPKITKVVKECPLVELVIVVRPKSSKEQLPFGFIDFQTVLETTPCLSKGPLQIVAKEDLLMLPYSSGTTGVPKGVMLTHQNFGTMINAYIWYNQNNVYPTLLPGFDPCKENHLLILPFYHIFGIGVIISSLMEGFTVVTMSQFKLDLYCQCIQDYKIRQLYLVPPIAIALAKSPIIDKYNLSSLNNVCSGAAPLGEEICKELKQRLNIKYIGQGYGLTEISMAGLLPESKVEVFNACGFLLPTLELKIVDIKTGDTLPSNKQGEVCFRGPTIFKGYFNKPRATAETIDNDGWLHTGDIGFTDEKGQLHLVDRMKELIKVKGFQVPPAELEDLILSHSQVADCAVIGVSHQQLGEAPKAYVVRKSSSLTEQQVIDYVAGRVAKYKQLQGGVEFIDQIPKNPSGKILRRELRDRQKTKAQL